MPKLLSHIYIFLTILFTIFSQLIMKWQVNKAGPLPVGLEEKLSFVFSLLLMPWVLIAMLSTFLAGVSWMLAMTKFEISYAFPFMSLNYVLVLFASFIVFNESFSVPKIIGSLVVVFGILIISKG
jgi:drug/metabolite transporter (DMT)-like permease